MKSEGFKKGQKKILSIRCIPCKIKMSLKYTLYLFFCRRIHPMKKNKEVSVPLLAFTFFYAIAIYVFLLGFYFWHWHKEDPS